MEIGKNMGLGGILICGLIAFFCFSHLSGSKGSGLAYEVLDAGPAYSIVLLKEDATAAQMDIVADSLYATSQHKVFDPFHVMFYFRRDYQGHVCYADKLWTWNREMKPVMGKLDITGIKSKDP